MSDCVLYIDVIVFFINVRATQTKRDRELEAGKRRGFRECETVKQIHSFCSRQIAPYILYKSKYRILANSQYSCYKAPIFEPFSLFVMSAIGRLKTGFAGAVAATALFAAPACAQQDTANAAEPTPISFTTGVALDQRDEPFCGELRQASDGQEINAGATAHRYSQDNLGYVGISIFAGQDLGEYTPEYLGTALVNSLRRRGVEAECFVNHTPNQNGTSVDFHIAGLSWNGDGGLSISQALNAELMDSITAEARTAGMLLVAANSPDFTNR